MMLSDLPKACAQILDAPGPQSADQVTYGLGAKAAAGSDVPAVVPDQPPAVPLPKQRTKTK